MKPSSKWSFIRALHELTIGVVCSTRTPCQDIIGVRLHCSAAVFILAFAQQGGIEIGVPVFRDCNFGKRMNSRGAGEEEQVSGLCGSGAHGVRCEVLVEKMKRMAVRGASCSECLARRVMFPCSAQSQSQACWWLGRVQRDGKDDDKEMLGARGYLDREHEWWLHSRGA